MTLGTLVVIIAITALLLTLGIGLTSRRINNWLVSYFQNFCGALFIFSGWVKAVDPMGTAFKLEQYFAEFESTFSGTWFSFLSPLFPWLAEYAIGFSVFMIVLEIVLGIMLLIGSARKFAAWAFLLIVVFFTFLTGFTYLTGYVPEGVNFFQFGHWGPYVETNMKVTDCGCFGDFLKLKPKVSFLKDIFLLFPSFLFVFAHGKMHQLMSAGSRTAVVLISTAALLFYCFTNFMWGLPHMDFRPFKAGRNIRLERALESLAENNVEVEAYRMTNKASGEVVELPLNEYLRQYKDYPKEEWGLEQVQSQPRVAMVRSESAPEGYIIPSAEGEPYEQELVAYLKERWGPLQGDTISKVIEHTKVSDFEAVGPGGSDISEELLSNPEYSFMVIAYKLKAAREETVAELVTDTIYAVDTVAVEDTIKLVRRADRVDKKQVEKKVFTWDQDYNAPWVAKVKPLAEAAGQAGIKTFAITALAGNEKLESFKAASGCTFPFYTADDILLKTIVRSNPGVVLLKNGRVIQKWHHKQLPSFEEIKEKYMK
ncbi:MAG: DoxX family protein [Phaeodactylibacter sp.]|nr:DoxX family protein [Phaeodactylibacter sp.]MCB9052455.1 DoxX family protein [Lewinellaceae bacterium]